MTASKPPPFVLPSHPVDRYEVAYFRISGSWDDPYIRHYRCVYYVNATWTEVNPDRASEGGSDFVNHWYILEDSRPCGRSSDGWTAVLKGDWTEAFATFEEARVLAVDWLTKSLAAHRAKVVDIERHLAAMEARRSDLPER